MTSRRAGKTTLVMIAMAELCRTTPNAKCAYLALTRSSAKNILWQDLKKLSVAFDLKIRFVETSLIARFPNGAQIQLMGCDAVRWADRILGQRFNAVVIDEAAAFLNVDLRNLIHDILEPTLLDSQGTIWVVSTPGVWAKGYYYNIMQRQVAGWSIHEWNTGDNPHMAKQWQSDIARKLAQDPEIEKDPIFVRTMYGLWCEDTENRVYRYDPSKHTSYGFTPTPTTEYILGIDNGYHPDPCGFVILAHNGEQVIALEAHTQREMLIRDMAELIKQYQIKYPNLHIVSDWANSRWLFAELDKEHGIQVELAEKQRKLDWIEIINGDLLMGRIVINDPLVACQILDEQMRNLRWAEKRRDGKLLRIEDPSQRNDVTDAFMYAYRKAKDFLGRSRPKPVDLAPTPEWYDSESFWMPENTEWWKR